LHVQAVAAATTALTQKGPLANDAMLAGLLHDIGYWVLAQECPADLSAAVKLAISSNIPLYIAETEIIGASHAEIGAYLLGIWGLPYPVVEAVAHHHQPGRVTQAHFDVLTALVTGISLVTVDDASAFSGAIPADPKVDASYLKSCNAPFDWNEAERRVTEATQTEQVTT